MVKVNVPVHSASPESPPAASFAVTVGSPVSPLSGLQALFVRRTRGREATTGRAG
jgi:hypothetical protein